MQTSVWVLQSATMAGQFVAYYRVSTDRQGRSGLGLDAQSEAVRAHLANHSGTLQAEFCEIESGKRSDYSITSSASARSLSGISRWSAFAVLRLITNSNLVGCHTGRSAGFGAFLVFLGVVAPWRSIVELGVWV